MLSPLRSIVTLLLAPLALTPGAAATTTLADGYAIRVWQTDDGLPQNLVHAAVQTRDGYLWFGTQSGLARFDGERFTVFDPTNAPGMQDRRITRLFADAEGTLWIGHQSGGVTRYREGRFETRLMPSGDVSGKIIGLGSDEQGRLWAMHENGAVDSLDGRASIPSLLPASDRPAVMGWANAARGNLWVVENGTSAQLVDGRLVAPSLPPPQGSNYVLGLAASKSGGAWILCDNRIRRWDHGRWVEDLGEFPWERDAGGSCLELRDGTLAVGTLRAGLFLVFRDGRPAIHFDHRNGLPQDWVRFLYEDREGNLWIGADSAGLVSIHPTAFSFLQLSEPARNTSVLSVAAAPNGTLWVGTDGTGLQRYAGGNWKHFGPEQGLANWYIPALAVSPQGDVWACDFWWGGPYRLEGDRFVRPPGLEENSSASHALLATGDAGEVLIGNRDGLRRWRDGRSTWLVKSPATPAPEVCAIARDREGAIWCGFAQGGLARSAAGQTSRFGLADGLASEAVQALCVDREGTLWIGTADHGLSRYKDGRFVNLGREHGLADNAVCAVLDDGMGFLWLSTRHGIQRIAKEDIERCADGKSPTFSSQIYDRSDGLPIVEFTGGFQSVACRAPDGRLWFACSKGLVSVDPARVESNPLPPPVVIDSLWVDGKNRTIPSGAPQARLAPDHQRLEFRFAGLSFVSPAKVQFKYRLEGIDGTWIDAGAKRNAFYSRLPAGTYRFRVIACNNDRLWNLEGASMTFTVAPFFWQTWWFLSACLLATVGAVAWTVRAITRRRMQRQIEAMERQHELERERARIAQDIHDDVGASLSRIAMLSQPARSDLAEPERAAAMLSRIYSTAREVTRSLDEIVWAIDPRHDTLDSLVDYMGKFAQNFLAPARLRCRLDLPVQVPAWPLTAEVRHNLFLSFKEALNNAARHAAATEVRISFRVRPDSFTLEVKDNGQGFSPARTSANADRVASGHGLTNMKARLARIGGRCEISGETGQGTSVSFIIGVASQPAVPASDPAQV
ncbi:MAG: ATP-binding protein [Opitutae bacterium]|nr:ATP-binding protein [Opitutae bacterium]